MENELARNLLIHGNDFKTFYEILSSNDFYHNMVDTVMTHDTYQRITITEMNFDIMADQREAFMAAFTFVNDYCKTNLTNLVIESSRANPIVSIHVKREYHGQ